MIKNNLFFGKISPIHGCVLPKLLLSRDGALSTLTGSHSLPSTTPGLEFGARFSYLVARRPLSICSVSFTHP